MKVVHQIKFPDSVSAFGLTADMSHLAVGLADGTFVLKKNKSKIKKVEKLKGDEFLFNVETKAEVLNYKYFFRGIYNKIPDYIDKQVDLVATGRLKDYDRFLR